MTSAESANYARRYVAKAEEYLASAQDNLDLERATRQAVADPRRPRPADRTSFALTSAGHVKKSADT